MSRQKAHSTLILFMVGCYTKFSLASRITLSPTALTTYRGDNVTFFCHVQGTPPTITFFVLQDAQHQDVPHPSCAPQTTTAADEMITCEIPTAQLDLSVYKLQCFNSGAASGEQAFLEVTNLSESLTWSILPVNKTIMVGESDSVFCKGNSSSAHVKYTWLDLISGTEITNDANFKTMVTLGNTAILMISPQQVLNSTAFMCKASNGFQTIYTFFQVKTYTNISIIRAPQDIRLSFEDLVPGKVVCEFDSDPPVNVSWALYTNSNTPLALDANQITTRQTGSIVSSEAVVTPELVSKFAAKSISCVANNGFVTSTLSANVEFVQIPAKILNASRDFVVQDGSKFILIVKTEGSPTPRVSWMFTDDTNFPIIIPDVTPESNGLFHRLSVGKIHYSGTFTCVAQNSGGSDQKSFHVRVI